MFRLIHRSASDHRIFGATLLALFGLCIAVGTVGAQTVRHWALQNEAQLAGMDWAHHIEAQLNDQPGSSDQMDVPDLLPKLLSDVIAIGNIYQIDYVDLSCMCELSVGGYENTPEQDLVHDHGDGPHSHRKNGEPDHTVADAPIQSDTPADQARGQFPIDLAEIARVGDSNIHEAKIRHGDGVAQPRIFATVYHPVMTDIGPLYVLRVLVDLEDQDSTLQWFFLLTILLGLLMLALLAGYPTLRYIRTARKQQASDAEVIYLAHHDVLTGLNNRNNFQARLPQILDTAEVRQAQVTLILLDLKDFKSVNEIHGHHVGDAVLSNFADLIKEKMPEDAYIARLGGDEFVIILQAFGPLDKGLTNQGALPPVFVTNIAGKRRGVEIGIRGGTAQFPDNGEDAAAIFHAANLALDTAKLTKEGRIVAFHPEMEMAFQNRSKLKNDLKEAIEAADIVPFYQPIHDLDTGKIVSFEALARWRKPDGSHLEAGAFESTLRDPEIGAALGQAMLKQIAADMVDWQNQNVPFSAVGLNVMTADLMKDNYAADVLKLLAQNHLHPAQLVIEVTEHCLFDDESGDAIYQLSRLQDAGCGIALDDFGTGYSSISQLKRLPFTAIKIDKSFVQNAQEDSDDLAIIQALHFLGKSMDFNIVLEGIEHLEQLVSLKAAGHAFGQGYHFARPMPAADVADYLAASQNQTILQSRAG